MTAYLARIWRLRHFWLALVRNDLRNRYRRSIIGMGWSLLQPIAMTIVLCVVFSQLFHAELRTYAPYLLSGLTFWGFLMAVVFYGLRILDPREPAHELGRQAPRDAVGQQEVQVLLQKEAREEWGGGHDDSECVRRER